MAGEFEYIAWLRSQTPDDPRVVIGPGDDCAALLPGSRPLLVTTDMLMDGTDFVLASVGPRRAGRKAMSVNLSDIAAMAGVPTAAVVSVALPKGPTPSPALKGGEQQEAPSPTPSPRGEGLKTEERPVLSPPSLSGKEVGGLGSSSSSPSLQDGGWGGGASGTGGVGSPHGIDLARELYLGLRDVADAFGVALVGGDTNSWDGKLAISVTALGEATARGPVRRNGAKPGDWLFVTGPLGGSILGHHLDFTPRVREALCLHATVEIHAMIDISDGLAADVNHICAESACGAVLVAERIPIADAARTLSATSGRTPLMHALGDGEDFELVFAVSPEVGQRLLNEPPVPGLTKIGECVESGLWLEEGGVRKPLTPTGWVHDL
ncbi:thiamine-phosphate kinase [Frigoriglobus tundricola]|uniref:Thiamine-monophosphate kinase n=1 Tax=Frigoriglobus tundricola TaxID=2774151 RepID=A0A6M5Z093_9BACT|nr:thiamine-phosphate kinase [Frigoriglobus tundricola]QJW99578.1 Thiamine-monophosphate kinase [Frigoriglobus tundricola]